MTNYIFPKGFLWGVQLRTPGRRWLFRRREGITTADLMPIGQKRWDNLMGNLASYKP